MKTTKIIDINDDNFGLILNSAIRYALGRQTYLPSVIIDYITPLLPYLSEKTVLCFCNDLEDFSNDVQKGFLSWGMDCDEVKWKEFQKVCLQEKDRRDIWEK